MPDKRTHRGAHPKDAELFAPGEVDKLRLAVVDYSMLLSRGYAQKSSLKLVGDHFLLTQRQRLAVMRGACSDEQVEVRLAKQVDASELSGQSICIDGYNVLITVEVFLSGGLLFRGRDGCVRDIASIHSTYRKVTETVPALELISEVLDKLGVGDVLWLFDRPVSNSGRLKGIVEEVAGKSGWSWRVELTNSPDSDIIRSERIAATSDSDILDKCGQWTNLVGAVLRTRGGAEIVDLSGSVQQD